MLPAILALKGISLECFLFRKSFCAAGEHGHYFLFQLPGNPTPRKINSEDEVPSSQKVTQAESHGIKNVLLLQQEKEGSDKMGMGKMLRRE